ncbi:MAG: hypothetical protein Q7U20_11560 [Caulobacter sp.]|jgi:hypothetical protein|uniref:Uncharacterized protein n=1 Tax=uncultured prokaryote TaxID=198431 RepID=A0A0H5PXI3_9ZZZZ|nr:hypothetical protein [Caulobacter sp.]CRY94456.1 hypothetical protein [uncultured prokaryote]
MPEVRMSLAEAGAILRIAPNSVRSRWKAGKLRGDRDNEGRIWVWLDPAAPPSKSRPSNPSIEGSNSGQVEALEAHIVTLREQLAGATAELATLRPRAAERDRLEAEAVGLRVQVEMLQTDRAEWRAVAQRSLEKGGGFLGLFRRR